MNRFPSFEEFFREVHGTEPYAWQRELAQRLQDGRGWPWHLAVPTGLGKTAAVATAVYELARQCHLGVRRTAPQRIFHVVDRRAIIDSTTQYAMMIADRINDAPEGSVLRPVQDALRTLLGPGDRTVVAVSGIHGQSPDDRAWLRSTGLSIISLTSHQFMSRLLFRGHGVSPAVRPIAAGLCAIDRLVLFDEPHLSAQSVHTILDAERLQKRAAEDLGLADSATVLLGATVPDWLAGLAGVSRGHATDEASTDHVLRLDRDRETSAEAKRRLGAKREAFMVWTASSDSATEKALLGATREAWSTGAERVVVFVNTVAMAQTLYEKLLRTPKAASRAEHRILLLTSRFRPHDRRSLELQEGPLTVVATQTLEVGVDLSFDALVTEACPWSALVQRLGRLNRDGKSDRHGRATVIAGWNESTHQPAPRKASAFVYGEEAMAGALTLLRSLEKEPGHPFRLDSEALARIDPPGEGEKPRVGTLHAGHLPLLTQTVPTPDPDIPLSALIEGPEAQGAEEVEIAWRTDLVAFDDGRTPRIGTDELVSVPRRMLMSFLASGAAPTGELHDIIGGGEPAAEDIRFSDIGARGLSEVRILDESAEKWRAPASRSELARATRVVLASDRGGYSPVLGWTGQQASAEVSAQLDVSLQVAQHDVGSLNASRSRVDFVLSAATLAQTPDDEHERVRELIAEAAGELAEGTPASDLDTDELEEAARAYVSQFIGSSAEPAEPSSSAFEVVSETVMDDSGADTNVVVLVTVRWRNPGRKGGEPLVLLDDHQRQVALWSSQDAAKAGLPPELAAQLAHAGLHHDDGKEDPRFQQYLGADSSPWLAKSRRLFAAWEDQRRRQQCGIPSGWRHEALSTDGHGVAEPPCLVQHLVRSHHGWFRPLLRPVGDPYRPDYPQPLTHADEFALLNERFGAWGLAYLEAVLRLADWRASAFPEKVMLDGLDQPHTVEDPPTRAERNSVVTRLEGLHTHPLTGWFAVVGLLAAAQSDDPHATVRWEPLSDDGVPLVPVVHTAIPIAELVERLITDPRWQAAQETLWSHGFPKTGLRAKNQKLGNVMRLREMLLETENPLLLGLVGDLFPAEGTSGQQQISLPIVPLPNNASYPNVALERTAAGKMPLDRAIKEALAALTSVEAGFAGDRCDGGMDRSPVLSPGVNGLGDRLAPQTRSALAPLALYGMAALGAGTPRGIGVTASRDLVLPFPTVEVSFAQLRALSYVGRGPRNWDWRSTGLEWIYGARIHKLSQYESVWRGALQKRRSE